MEQMLSLQTQKGCFKISIYDIWLTNSQGSLFFSAGIGRTGAFIVIDCMLERLRYEHTVDIFGCVQALRAQRTYMVQVTQQFQQKIQQFLHRMLSDELLFDLKFSTSHSTRFVSLKVTYL